MKNHLIKLAGVALLIAANSAWSGVITCGNLGVKQAQLGSAENCLTGTGNTQGNGTQINNLYGPTWTQRGSVEGSNGTNALLTTEVEGGSWGQDVSGLWRIDSSFWDLYAEAIISIHVGNGQGDPDHFAWLITEGHTSGTFAYTGPTGLSNMKLWSRGDASSIPEPASLMLLSLGLAGLASLRKLQLKK